MARRGCVSSSEVCSDVGSERLSTTASDVPTAHPSPTCHSGSAHSASGTSGTYLVCAFVFLLSFKPSEPFLVAYLSCDKGLPKQTVISDIFPFWTYAYLALLPSLSAIAELVGYRAVVIVGMCGRLLTLILLVFGGNSLWILQLSQAKAQEENLTRPSAAFPSPLPAFFPICRLLEPS